MVEVTQAAWLALWQRLAPVEPPSHYFEEVLQRYSEPARAYHTLTHIAGCLAHLSHVEQLAHRPDCIAAAIWLHDIVYDPKRGDNETASAAWATTFCRACQVPAVDTEQISQLILATQHGAAQPQRSTVANEPAQLDRALLLDIDLAILGAAPAQFQQYEQQVRQEYAWVPLATFCQKRAALLQQFLERPVIYETLYFQERFEANARHNLHRSIANLRHGLLPAL